MKDMNVTFLSNKLHCEVPAYVFQIHPLYASVTVCASHLVIKEIMFSQKLIDC